MGGSRRGPGACGRRQGDLGVAGGGNATDEARARFPREARITATLQHPHIVTVHDLGRAATAEGGAPFLVMELLRGDGLEAAVRRGPVGGADATRLRAPG
ncbi:MULTISPECIES: hypothetical protein [unclassified Streptomyces]|uniref:hypothetical protein n=1 Tax=unclassified Streptomyces TaxID=2593676 RepID=UPI0036E05703